MFGIERLQAIRELVKEKKSVEVTYLSKELNVSEVTIRRDLDKLEKEGLVAKTYGGAILIEDYETSAEIKHQESLEVKSSYGKYKEITATAAKIINQGDTVFIHGGEVGISLCQHLRELEDLIIVTTNIEIAMFVYSETDHKVVILGGEIDTESGNVVELDQLDELLIEKSFVSVDGVDEQFGYTVNEKNDVRLYKKLKSVSRDLILVAPSDRYSKRGLMKLAPLKAFETIVSDKGLPDSFKEFYYDNNIKVHTTMLN